MAQQLKQKFKQTIRAIDWLSDDKKKAILKSIDKQDMLDTDPTLRTRICFYLGAIFEKSARKHPELINAKNEKFFKRLQHELDLREEPTLTPPTKRLRTK